MSQYLKLALGAVVIASFTFVGCTPNDGPAVKVGTPETSRPTGGEVGQAPPQTPGGGTSMDRAGDSSRGTAPGGASGAPVSPGSAGNEKAPNGAQPSPRPQNGQPGAPNGARGQFGGRRGAGGSLMLLRMEAVQSEIKLTDDQKKKLEGLMTSFRPGSAQGERPDPEKMLEAMRKAQEEADKILNASQKARLEELQIQRQGADAIGNPAVAQKLGLSDVQKKQVEDIQKSMGEKMQAMFPRPGGDGQPGGRNPGGQGAPGGPGAGGGDRGQGRGQGGNGDGRARYEEMSKLREETQTKLMNVLTADQKTKFKTLQGKPFDFPQRGFGGNRGGGGGGPRGAGGNTGA